MLYLRSPKGAIVVQKLTILERTNTHVPVSGTSSILFPKPVYCVSIKLHKKKKKKKKSTLKCNSHSKQHWIKYVNVEYEDLPTTMQYKSFYCISSWK